MFQQSLAKPYTTPSTLTKDKELKACVWYFVRQRWLGLALCPLWIVLVCLGERSFSLTALALWEGKVSKEIMECVKDWPTLTVKKSKIY